MGINIVIFSSISFVRISYKSISAIFCATGVWGLKRSGTSSVLRIRIWYITDRNWAQSHFLWGYRRCCVSGFLLENFDWRVGSDRTLESDWLAPLKLFIISGSKSVQNKFFPRKTRPKFYNYFSNRRKNVKWGFSTFSPNTLHTQNSIEILQSLMKNFNPYAVGIFYLKWWSSLKIFVIRNNYDFLHECPPFIYMP